MSVTPSPIGGFAAQFFDNNGVILSGGKIYTYAAGTTTPQAVYTSASGVTPHANPIILDSAGRVPGGEIWLTDGLVYKFVIETAASILIGTYDNITGVNSNFVNYTVQEEVITATAGQTVFDLSTINYTPGTNSLTVYIDGVNQYVGDSYLETDSDTVTFTSGVHVGGEVKFTTAIQTTTGAVDASIVSYEPPFTGSVATNVEAKLAQYVSVKDFGAVGDGVADDTAAIQAAADTGYEIFIPRGTFRVTDSIVFPSDMLMTFDDGAEIFADTGTYTSDYVLVASGSVTAIPDLGVNADQGATSLTFASGPSLSFDDTILIFNPTNSSWSGFRPDYKAGEFVNVEDVSGTSVALQSPLFDSYVTTDVDLYKVNYIRANLQNPRIRSVGSALGSIFIEYGRNVQITNPQIAENNNSCIVLSRCFEADIFGGRCVNKGDGGDDYGLSIANSQSITVHGGYWYGRRHGVASGGDGNVGCVPVRNLKYIGSRISNDYASGTHAADFHGNAEYCGFYDCLIQGGVSPQGANISIVNCDLYGGISTGPVVYGAEVLGGHYKISGNRIYAQADPFTTLRGVVDFGGNNNSITANTTRDFTIEVRDNTFVSTALSASTVMVYINNRGTTQKINIDCSGNDFNVNDFLAAVRVRLISGTADSDFLICDNNRTKLVGRYSFYPDADYIDALSVLRAQGYRWTSSVTTSVSASYIAATSVTFHWRFPREPSVTTAKIDSLYIGNRIGIVVATPVTNQAATLVIGTDDGTNFSSATTVKICGDASIQEV